MSFHCVVFYLDDDHFLLHVCCSHICISFGNMCFRYLLCLHHYIFMVFYVRIKLYMCDLVVRGVWYCFLLGIYYVVLWYYLFAFFTLHFVLLMKMIWLMRCLYYFLVMVLLSYLCLFICYIGCIPPLFLSHYFVDVFISSYSEFDLEWYLFFFHVF